MCDIQSDSRKLDRVLTIAHPSHKDKKGGLDVGVYDWGSLLIDSSTNKNRPRQVMSIEKVLN